MSQDTINVLIGIGAFIITGIVFDALIARRKR